jgi:hypothetical protein
MASQQNTKINDALNEVSQSLEQTSLRESSDDVIKNIDRYLEGFSISEDEFDQISTDDIEILDEPLEDEPDTNVEIPISIPVCVVQPSLVDDAYDDIESSKSATPPPTVSPIPDEQTIDVPKPKLPSFFFVTVYGRQQSDFRSHSVFYGAYTTPYLPALLKTRSQFHVFVDKAEHLIKQMRPFNEMRHFADITVSSPEISFVSEDGHDTYLYQTDFKKDVNQDIPEPKALHFIAPVPISVSVLVHASFKTDRPPKQDKRKRSPSPSRMAECSYTSDASMSEYPEAKRRRTKRRNRTRSSKKQFRNIEVSK